jgi:hypothetical protein
MGRPQKPAKDGVGTLDLLILSRLAKGSIHGYGIAEISSWRRIVEAVNRAIEPLKP